MVGLHCGGKPSVKQQSNDFGQSNSLRQQSASLRPGLDNERREPSLARPLDLSTSSSLMQILLALRAAAPSQASRVGVARAGRRSASWQIDVLGVRRQAGGFRRELRASERASQVWRQRERERERKVKLLACWRRKSRAKVSRCRRRTQRQPVVQFLFMRERSLGLRDSCACCSRHFHYQTTLAARQLAFVSPKIADLEPAAVGAACSAHGPIHVSPRFVMIIVFSFLLSLPPSLLLPLSPYLLYLLASLITRVSRCGAPKGAPRRREGKKLLRAEIGTHLQLLAVAAAAFRHLFERLGPCNVGARATATGGAACGAREQLNACTATCVQPPCHCFCFCCWRRRARIGLQRSHRTPAGCSSQFACIKVQIGRAHV